MENQSINGEHVMNLNGDLCTRCGATGQDLDGPCEPTESDHGA
jgi:hypothetical protein